MKRKQGLVKAFTLVELLVVIGIIGLLLSILLPALSRAREQANQTICLSNMHQFYNLFMLYVDDYRGYVLPATIISWDQTSGKTAEDDFYSYDMLGNELNKSSALKINPFTSNSADQNAALANASIIQHVLTCPSANHSQDPGFNDPTNSQYFGDYVYNYWMGVIKFDTAAKPAPGVQYVYITNPKLTQVPGNVMLLVESFKPNDLFVGGSWQTLETLYSDDYKPYFGGRGSAQGMNELVQAQAVVAGDVNKIGTPHGNNKLCNILSADGHVSLIDPFSVSGGLFTSFAQAKVHTPIDSKPTEPREFDYSVNPALIKPGVTATLFSNYLIGPGVNNYTLSVTDPPMPVLPMAPGWDKTQAPLP